MLKKNFLHWVAVVIALACWLTPGALFAQQGAAVLTGTVVDASDKSPVGDVVVTVTSPALQGEQTVVTDSTGLYRVPDLPPGVYTLRLDKEKFKPYAREGITLRTDTTIRVNAELLPEALKAEEVTVVARPPTVDVGSSSTGMNIGQDFTRRVPVGTPSQKGSANRSFEAVAEAVPGARDDHYGTSISGTTSPENNYVLDGTSVGNPTYGIVGTPLSIEFIKELNVISGGYMPEYGRSTGGILNAVTKTGSNEFHGGAFTYYTPGALEGTRKVVSRAGQTVQTVPSLAYIGDIGADVGGPIQKDKLWFYVGVDFARSQYTIGRQLQQFRLDPTDPTNKTLQRDASGAPIGDPMIGSYKTAIADQNSIQALGKLTYAVNQDNTLTLTAIAAPSTSGGQDKWSLDPQTGLYERDPRNTQGANGTMSALANKRIANAYDASFKWSSAFNNKRVLLDTTLGWHHQDTAVLPMDGTDPGSLQGLSGTPAVIWRAANHAITEPQFGENVPSGYCTINPALQCPVQTFNTGGSGFEQRQSLNRYQGRSILTLLLQGAGHHVVKAGVDLELDSYGNDKAYTGYTTYREASSGASFSDYRGYSFLQGPDDAVLLPKVHTDTKSVTAGGFLQDSWSILDKITLNLGVRYDAQFLYNAAGDRGLSLPNEWSPRIGAIYDPTQNGRSKIFANYARFYESVPLDAADRSLSSEPQVSSNHPPAKAGTPCASGPQPAGGAGPCLDPALRNTINPGDPNSKWNTLGAGSTPVDPDIKPQSSDEFVAGGEYEVVKDGRLGASYTKRWINYIIEDMSRDEATTYFLGNPGYGIAKDFPKPVRNYDAVTIYFSKIFADQWLGEASYTISRLYGNWSGLFLAENNQLDPNITGAFDLISLLPNTTGPLPGDRTHQIKIFGAKEWDIDPKDHVMTGMAFRAHSGEPTNYLGSHAIYGANTAFILPRGSGERTPWVFTADLNIGYRFNIDKDKTLSATVDIFNLFNFQAATARDQQYTTADTLPIPNGTPSQLPVKTGPNSYACGGAAAPNCALRSSNGKTYDPDPSTIGPNGMPKAAGVAPNPNFGNPVDYQPPRQFRFGLRMTF
jgi:outer membrane receptor protein involved in Fe transport